MALSKEQLLAEVEELLRKAPPQDRIKEPLAENFAWLGRGAAGINEWDSVRGIAFRSGIDRLQSAPRAPDVFGEFNRLMVTLHQARVDLRLKTGGPLSVAIGTGMVFDYFDELR